MPVWITNPAVAGAWSSHKCKWSSCNRCSLGSTTINHVLGRGKLPCEVLFLGEAPGPNENIVGEPFIGPAGIILDALLKELKVRWRPFSYFISNTLACYPSRGLEDPHPNGFRAPTTEEIEACLPRVLEVLEVSRPKALVLLGKSAEASYERVKTKSLTAKSSAAEAVFARMKTSKAIDDLLLPATVISVWHPSYILRNGGIASRQFGITVEKLLGLEVLDVQTQSI